ncbi:phosphopantetheine-binding protein [Streptomyces sp. NPDC050636]|uniref:phosphopantetheine-binding protein n=1 Tax=Streptomyces sp. NPDC050636 TaxID=3154510 RepID=UPI003428D1A4
MPEINPLTMDSIKSNVADILGLSAAEIGDDDNLLVAGLDSIRMMTLSARWRESGVEVSFADLARKPTVRSWSELLGAVA